MNVRLYFCLMNLLMPCRTFAIELDKAKLLILYAKPLRIAASAFRMDDPAAPMTARLTSVTVWTMYHDDLLL